MRMGNHFAAVSCVGLMFWYVVSQGVWGVTFEDPDNFGEKRTWSGSSLNVPGNLGGMLFTDDGQTLYVVGNSEATNSALYAVPLTRDPVTKEVTDMGPADNVTLVFDAPGRSGLDAGWEIGPEGTLFYTYWDDNYLGQRPGGVSGTETLYYMGDAGLPQSIAGLTFSPYIQDPNTNFGIMQVSVWGSNRTLYNIPLNPLGGGLFEPQGVEVFVNLPRQGTGAIQYIPSGPLEGDMMYVNWDYGEVWILEIDEITGLPIDDTTGSPTLGTDNPRVQRFAYGLGVGPWGLEFDPLTNDFFVSTWQGSPRNTIIQIGGAGLPPPELKIITESLPEGREGQPYSATLQATGGVPPYDWSIAGGNLPDGLSLANMTGVVMGTPTEHGDFDFTVQVTDTDEPGNTDSRDFTLRIEPAYVEVSFTISSDHDAPDPPAGTYTYTAGDTVPSGSVTSPADQDDGTRYACTGYAGTGSAPSSIGTGDTSYPGLTITEDSTLTWHWMPQYRVMASAEEGGSISPEGETWYDLKYDATFTGDACNGFRVDTWFVDGEPVQEGGNTYTLTYIRAPHEVVVTFRGIAPGSIMVRSNFEAPYRLERLSGTESIDSQTEPTDCPKLFERPHQNMNAGEWRITWLPLPDAWPRHPTTETKVLAQGGALEFSKDYIVRMPSELYQLHIEPINYATGTFTARVRITNATGEANPPARTFTAPIWLVVKDIEFTVSGPHSEGRLWNADGMTSDQYPGSGDYYYKDVSSWAPLDPGETSPEIILVFYIKDRNPNFKPIIEVWADDPVAATASAFRVESVLCGPSGSILVQWDSEAGAAYVVEAAGSLMGPWTEISNELVCNGGLTEWADEPPEDVRCRFYRVRLLSP